MSVVSRPAATGAPSIASLLPALDSVAPIAEEAVQALLKCKKLVFLNRIRLKPFLLDFDKLRTGQVFESQFLSALSQSGLHKFLSPQQLQSIANIFKTKVFDGNTGNCLFKVKYTAFLHEVESVFGEKNLEKNPLVEVAREPIELLDRLRYRRTTKQLDPAKEARIKELLDRILTDCKIKGIQVKSAFDDWAHAPKLSKIVNHVTTSQFFQGLCKLNLGINASDASLLAEKFGHEELPDLVNYALFSTVANPTTSPAPNGSAAPGAPTASPVTVVQAPAAASA